MHLTKQNNSNMTSPPLSQREFASVIQEHSRIINKVCYRIAVNTALMALRSSRSNIETVSLAINLPDISSEIDDAQRENLQSLHTLINRLEDMEKAIILLWLDEHTYDEIADTLGMKRNTVATKIRRIKDKLSKLM